MARYVFRLAASGLALALVHPFAFADPGNPLTDRFSVSLGTFLLSTSTEIRVDGDSRTGTAIDLEQDLGFDDTDRFRADAYWRFKERHKLRVLYFSTRQSSTKRIEREIVFNDQTFQINTEVAAEFGTKVAELAYEYAFLKRERYELAGTFGIHTLQFNFDLAATGTTAALAQSASANGPLPVIGLHGVWRFSDHFYADAAVQFFRLEVSPYKGRLEDYTASIVWQPFRHFGIGAGYNEFVTRLEVDGDRFNGQARWRYGGARIFVTASF